VVHLRPQLTDLLSLLARHAARTVPKHVILDEVWASQYVGESALTRCIAEIRQALGDDARRPTIIETIPKRGYRLVAPVAFLPAGAPHANGGDGRAEIGRNGFDGHRAGAPSSEGGAAGDSAEERSEPHAAPARAATVTSAAPALRDVPWKILIALALLLAVTLAAGRCGTGEAVGTPGAAPQAGPTGATHASVTPDNAPTARGSGRVDSQ
jgi:hypothetical protein